MQDSAEKFAFYPVKCISIKQATGFGFGYVKKCRRCSGGHLGGLEHEADGKEAEIKSPARPAGIW